MAQERVANGLNQIMNAKKAKKTELEIKNYSKMLISILALGKLKGYIKDYHIVKDILIVEIGKLNECRAIKPRFTVRVGELKKYEERFLPAKGLGILILSTSEGLITSETAKNKNIGGCLIAYMY